MQTTEIGECLPQQISACLFDLDGVITDTARVHAAAWKDPPDSQTVQVLGIQKIEIVLRRIRSYGVQAYPGSVAQVRAVPDAGLRLSPGRLPAHR